MSICFFTRQKDNVNIEEDERHRVFSDEHGNAKLVIQPANEADTGLYFCIAENAAGKSKCAATLRVVGK